MRFFWDWYTNVSGSCSTQPDGDDMLDLYMYTRLEGGLQKDNFFSKMDAGVQNINLPSCLINGRFDEYAVWNGSGTAFTMSSHLKSLIVVSVISGVACDPEAEPEETASAEEAGASPSCDEVLADVTDLCQTAASEADCAAASSNVQASAAADGTPCFQCIWSDWVRVPPPAEECSFEALPATCELDTLVGGCAGTVPPCGGDELYYRTVGDTVELLAAPLCGTLDDVQPCFDPGGVLLGPPECECACEAEFPGA